MPVMNCARTPVGEDHEFGSEHEIETPVMLGTETEIAQCTQSHQLTTTREGGDRYASPSSRSNFRTSNANGMPQSAAASDEGELPREPSQSTVTNTTVYDTAKAIVPREMEKPYTCPLCTTYTKLGWSHFVSRQSAVLSLRRHLEHHLSKAHNHTYNTQTTLSDEVAMLRAVLKVPPNGTGTVTLNTDYQEDKLAQLQGRPLGKNTVDIMYHNMSYNSHRVAEIASASTNQQEGAPPVSNKSASRNLKILDIKQLQSTQSVTQYVPPFPSPKSADSVSYDADSSPDHGTPWEGELMSLRAQMLPEAETSIQQDQIGSGKSCNYESERENNLEIVAPGGNSPLSVPGRTLMISGSSEDIVPTEKDTPYECPLCTDYTIPGWNQYGTRKLAVYRLQLHFSLSHRTQQEPHYSPIMAQLGSYCGDNETAAKDTLAGLVDAIRPACVGSSSQLPANSRKAGKGNADEPPSNPSTNDKVLSCQQHSGKYCHESTYSAISSLSSHLDPHIGKKHITQRCPTAPECDTQRKGESSDCSSHHETPTLEVKVTGPPRTTMLVSSSSQALQSVPFPNFTPESSYESNSGSNDSDSSSHNETTLVKVTGPRSTMLVLPAQAQPDMENSAASESEYDMNPDSEPNSVLANSETPATTEKDTTFANIMFVPVPRNTTQCESHNDNSQMKLRQNGLMALPSTGDVNNRRDETNVDADNFPPTPEGRTKLPELYRQVDTELSALKHVPHGGNTSPNDQILVLSSPAAPKTEPNQMCYTNPPQPTSDHEVPPSPTYQKATIRTNRTAVRQQLNSELPRPPRVRQV
ncbi:hypothetical protein Pelo_16369 [Pelomyxa schiedti]|nr:hypothetical protein Pelo_16369 [Pelomyxa schiedti]